MNIKIQSTEEQVQIRSDWQVGETKKVLDAEFPETQVDAYQAAAEFMEKHPQFVEVTFSTELSETPTEEPEEEQA